MDLSDRETQFVREYLVDLNATQACVRAGIATSASARSRGYELLRRSAVTLAIDEAMAECGAGPRQWLVTRLAEIARANIADFVDWDDKGSVTFKALGQVPSELKAVVKKIVRTKDGEVRIELHDPLRAIEILAKVGTIGLTRDAIQLQGELTLEQMVMMAYTKPGTPP